jgi:hypothetical protein
LDSGHAIAIPATPTRLEEPEGATSQLHASGYNLRPRRLSWKDVYALNATLKKALKTRPVDAIEAATSEIRQMLKRNVWKVYEGNDENHKVIHSSMFLKDKYLPNGSFEKYKARLVASGNNVDRSEYEKNDTSSPTVHIENVLALLALAAHDRMHLATADFPGAYLNAKVHKKHIMRLQPDIADIVVTLDPTAAKRRRRDGSLVVELKKALYGLPESGALWYEQISIFLLTNGYVAHPAEPCIFTKVFGSGRVIVALYVDDLLIAGQSKESMQQCIDEIKKEYTEVKVNIGTHLSFLGLDIVQDREAGSITVRQPAYVDEMLEGHTGKACTPATANAFEPTRNSPLLSSNRKSEFLSRTMRVMYLACRTRPDVLLATTILASRVSSPTEQDEERLNRVYSYLNQTRDLPLVLQPCNTTLHVSIDASFGSHPDLKSHSGYVFGIGGATFACKSKKQTTVANSSTDAELTALSDGIPAISGMSEILKMLGYAQGPVPVQQDNTSSITISEKGFSTATKAKHLSVRAAFVKEYLSNNIIRLIYTPTEQVLADVLTKPMTGKRFLAHRANLLNSFRKTTD